MKHLFLLLLLANNARAMSPAPFKNVNIKISELIVKSTMGPKNDGMNSEGKTEIISPINKVLWSIPLFMGRHKLHLPPDGKVLIATGNIHFEKMMSTNEDPVVATVYDKSGVIKTVKLSALTSASASKIAKAKNVQIMGGGWIPAFTVIKDFSVDWNKRSMTWKLFDDSSKGIKY